MTLVADGRNGEKGHKYETGRKFETKPMNIIQTKILYQYKITIQLLHKYIRWGLWGHAQFAYSGGSEFGKTCLCNY